MYALFIIENWYEKAFPQGVYELDSMTSKVS